MNQNKSFQNVFEVENLKEGRRWGMEGGRGRTKCRGRGKRERQRKEKNN